MGVDKNAIVASAQLFASKGQFEKAIAEWKKLAAESLADGTVWNTIGDLHLRRNAQPDAIEAFFQAAAAFRSAGAALKSIAVYKKILKLDPTRYKVYQHLGDLHAERGFVTNAVSDYLTLGQLYLKEGRTGEAVELYRTIAKLDPSNLEAKQRLVELGQREGVGAPPSSSGIVGAGEAGVSADRAPSQARGPAPLGVTQGPADAPRQTPREQASRLIQSGRCNEAESLLMSLLSSDPGNPEVCRLLALVHLRCGDLEVARGEFQFLAEAAMRAQEFALAESMLTEYLGSDPTCTTLLELLGRLYEQRGDHQAAVSQFGKAIEVLLEHPEPDAPTLAAELYAKITELAPASPLVSRFAPALSPAPQQGEASAVPPPRAAEPVSADDSEAHYELGVAYQNLGLLVEATEEFRVAAKGTERFLDACRMTAACLKQQGMIQTAIDCLEGALADPRCEGEPSVWVRYDLGLLYEAEGRPDSARQILSTIPTFSDVPMRLQRIGNGSPPTESARLAT